MSKYRAGVQVHFTYFNGYIDAFKVVGKEMWIGEQRYFLEDDGNPEHYSIKESQLKLANEFAKIGFEAEAE